MRIFNFFRSKQPIVQPAPAGGEATEDASKSSGSLSLYQVASLLDALAAVGVKMNDAPDAEPWRWSYEHLWKLLSLVEGPDGRAQLDELAKSLQEYMHWPVDPARRFLLPHLPTMSYHSLLWAKGVTMGDLRLLSGVMSPGIGDSEFKARANALGFEIVPISSSHGLMYFVVKKGTDPAVMRKSQRRAAEFLNRRAAERRMSWHDPIRYLSANA